MFRIQSFIAILSICFFSSCSISKEMEYKGYDNFTVTGGLDDPQIQVDLNLYNPNPIGAKLKKMELTISVNKTEIGSVDLEDPVKMKSREAFVVPIVMETTMDQLSTLTKPGIEALLFNKPLAIQISGNITIRKFIFKKTYQFDYADELNISDLKLN